MAYNEDDVKRMADKGRQPAYDIRGNVRGFRSRPGAPRHDPTSNNPMSRNNATSQSNWDNMFRNFVTGETPSSLAAARASGTQQQPGGLFGDPSSILDNAAGGGMNHAQQWSNYASQAAPSAKWSSMTTPYGQQKSVKSPFGWASAFVPNA